MARSSVSTDYRNSVEDANADEVDLIFVTLAHDDLDATIRVVNDAATPNGRPIEYDRDGVRWIGLPFRMTLLSDDNRPPRGQVEIANADKEIGLAIDALGTSPTVTIEVMKGSDFQRVGATHVWELAGTAGATPELTASNLRMENIQVDAMIVTADLVSYDHTRETWGLRVTKGRFPDLYR